MRVAVIDIGSNSIKLLVAERGPDGGPLEVVSRTIEARISDGIGSDEPSLGAGGIARGVEAVHELALESKQLGATQLVAVATSAVRDASNGKVFAERVRATSALKIRILSGLEEANLIGRGLTTDPALGALGHFDVFDLGGGSLECLRFRDRRIEHAVSLPLGCVRLTEMLVADPAEPFGEESSRAVATHVRRVLAASGYPFPVPVGFGVVGTGGTLTTARAMAGQAKGLDLAHSDPLITIAELRRIQALLAPMDLHGRREVSGLSRARADVFPTAVCTLLTLADLGNFRVFHHSLRNLRWGIASELLS